MFSGASALVFATAAAAQTQTAQVEEIVVTGSRVIRNGNASPTPLTVVSTDQLLQIRPGPVAEVIADLPVFLGSRTNTSNPGTGVTNAGANHLNLRNLGYNRSLILFDGNRVPPTTFDQVVDLSMIPQLLLQRVDVVTGGASAVYGSDAVSGVVNFITDRNFNGIKVNLEGGISDYGDNRTWNAGAAFGTSVLGGRGHFEGSYEYRHDPGIKYRSARPWGRKVWTAQGAGTAANPYRLVQDSRFGTYSFGGVISGATGTGAALNGLTFGDPGVPTTFVRGAATGTTGFDSGGAGAYHDGTLKTALMSHQMFGRFDYDFTEAVHGYLEASGTFNHGENFGQYNILANTVINGQSPYLTASRQFAGTFRVSRFMRDMERINTNTRQRQFFAIAGLDGKFGDSYRWDINASHSEARATTANDTNINLQRLAAAVDVIRDASGNIVCRSLSVNAGCVPLNILGTNAPTSAALGYITQRTQFTTLNKMDDITGGVSGSPFSTWAGPVTIALSGEWRRQTWSVESTAQPVDLANCTGIQNNCTQGTTVLWLDATLANRTPVSLWVAEAAAEFDAPLIKGARFAQSVSLNGAARFTHYNTSGSVATWKLGMIWQINDALKLRGTRSRDIRAPTLYDLFQPDGRALRSNTDTLTGVTVPVPTFTSGNPNLKPEVANTITAGFVYQPSWLARLSLSIDAYHIDISDAILNQTGYGQGNQDLCYASGGSSVLCTLQQRPLGSYTNTSAANAVSAWYVRSLNIAEFKAYGADFEANYTANLFGNQLSLRGLLTWQPHIYLTTPGSPTQDNAGGGGVSLGGGPSTAAPRVKAVLFGDYRIGGFTLGVRERWRSQLFLSTGPGIVWTPTNRLAPVAYTDLNLSYQLKRDGLGSANLYLNVQNLFDRQPEPFAGPSQSNNLGTFGGLALGDDAIGRYFTFGIRMRR